MITNECQANRLLKASDIHPQRTLDYNKNMKLVKKLGVFILILLPVLVAIFIPTAAHAFSLDQAQQAAANAQLNGEREAEVKALQVILEHQPWRHDKWIRLGELQYSLEDYEDAIHSFEIVQKAGALTTRAEYEYGKCWLAMGETEKARDVFRGLSERDVVDASFLLEVAGIQKSINDAYGTLATLLLAHGLEPDNRGINYELGIQFAATEPEHALFFLQDALKESQYQRGSSALINVIAGTTELGENAERYIYIGQQLSLLAEWEAAGSAFLKATEIDPQNAIAWALAGEAVQHVSEEGYPYLAKALELDPRSDIVNGLMAVYFRRQSKLDIALEYLYKAAENNPNESTWQIEIGTTLALQGELEDALLHYQMAAILEPEDWTVWKQVAAFCVTHNYEVETTGYEAARKALLLYPDSPSLLDLMGTVYMIMDELDQAEHFYLEADGLAPNQAEILYHLGQLYLEKGDKEKALDYLQQAAIFATDNRIRENANRLIITNGG
jgi:tetratricopeptide (TPR) repeat protein